MNNMDRTGRPQGRKRGRKGRRARRRREILLSWLTILIILAVVAGAVFVGIRVVKTWENKNQPAIPVESSREVVPETFPGSPQASAERQGETEASAVVWAGGSEEQNTKTEAVRRNFGDGLCLCLKS